MDARLAEEWDKRTRECREIRGNVLATCFEIEYLLDQIIAEAIIPTATNNADGQSLLDELFLKGPATNFRTKIEILRKLRSNVALLEPLIPEDTIANLTAIRELRNDFAHYPVTFEPTGDAPNQTLIPLLVSRRGRFVLDNVFLEKQGKIFASTHSTLEDTVRVLKSN
ncbi:MAG: hypothetical protein Q8M07_19520 [Prosthecobacter sp.]|nr:hypothetical protein [Prosthecobacter sp.]